jgi:hypothetical protein
MPATRSTRLQHGLAVLTLVATPTLLAGCSGVDPFALIQGALIGGIGGPGPRCPGLGDPTPRGPDCVLDWGYGGGASQAGAPPVP